MIPQLILPKTHRQSLVLKDEASQRKVILFDCLILDPGDFIPGPGAYQPKDRQINGNDSPKVTLKGRHYMRPGIYKFTI